MSGLALGAQLSQRLLAVLRQRHPVALAAQEHAQGLADRAVVLDDQDQRLIAVVSRAAFVPAAAAGDGAPAIVSQRRQGLFPPVRLPPVRTFDTPNHRLPRAVIRPERRAMLDGQKAPLGGSPTRIDAVKRKIRRKSSNRGFLVSI